MQQAVRIKGEQIFQSLVAHPEQVRIEDPDVFETARKSGQRWKRVLGLQVCGCQIQRVTREGCAITRRRLNHLAGRTRRGKRRAAEEYAAQKVTSYHKNILSLKQIRRIACVLPLPHSLAAPFDMPNTRPPVGY